MLIDIAHFILQCNQAEKYNLALWEPIWLFDSVIILDESGSYLEATEDGAAIFQGKQEDAYSLR